MSDNKKFYTNLLMVVGAIFILVSGAIFVSQTWSYLPDAVKKMLLLAVTGAFFAGSVLLEKKTELRKAPLLLYYLGVCFAGYATYSLLPILCSKFHERMLGTFLVMLIPVGFRFYRRRKVFDFIFQTVLVDGIVLCAAQLSTDNVAGYRSLLFAVVATALAGVVYYCNRYEKEEGGILRVAEILCLVHGLLSAPKIVACVQEGEELWFSVIPALLMVVAATVLWLGTETKALRVVQSVSIAFANYSIIVYVMERLTLSGYFRVHRSVWEIFFTFLVNLVVMVVMNRKELKVLNGFVAICATGFLMLEYVFQALFFNEPDVRFYPFAWCFAAAVLIRQLWKSDRTWKRTLMEVGVFFVLDLNTMFGFLWTDTFAKDHGGHFWFALVLLLFAAYYRDENENHMIRRKSFETCSMVVFLFSLAANAVLPTKFILFNTPVDFHVEYIAVIAAIGIVLCGLVWYHLDETVFGMLQFVLTCVLLLFMLCYNMSISRFPNVLFMAVATLGLLMIATVLKKKNYAIASAVTLLLLVIYLTRNIWMHLGWWVYLFVAGVALVVLAIKKEKAE